MSKGKSRTTTTTTVPEFQRRGYEYLVNKGISLENLPFNPYTDDPIAPMTMDQMAAGDTYRNQSQTYNSLSNPIVNFSNLAGRDIGLPGATGYNPTTAATNFDVSRLRDPRDATGYSVLDRNISSYMNPYTDSVIDKGLSDINKYRQMQLQSDQDSAIGSDAYGGSRSGILEGMTNEQYQDKANEFVAQQREKAYRDATGLIDQDLSRLTTADATNIKSDLERMGVDYDLLSDENKYALANAGIMNEANKYGADAINQFALTDAELDLANRDFDKSIYADLIQGTTDAARRQGAFGSMLQGQDQAGRDFDYDEFMRRESRPFDVLSAQTGAISGVPSLTSTSTSSRKKVGLMDVLAAGFGFAGQKYANS